MFHLIVQQCDQLAEVMVKIALTNIIISMSYTVHTIHSVHDVLK